MFARFNKEATLAQKLLTLFGEGTVVSAQFARDNVVFTNPVDGGSYSTSAIYTLRHIEEGEYSVTINGGENPFLEFVRIATQVKEPSGIFD